MSDPFTVAGVLAGAASGIIASPIQRFATHTCERYLAYRSSNGKSDPLIGDHHLARGTLRAALLAARSCVDRALEGENAANLGDLSSDSAKALQRKLAKRTYQLELKKEHQNAGLDLLQA